MAQKKRIRQRAATKVENERILEFKAQFFKALANPLRIRILNELRDQELTVSEIRDRLNIELPNVSQQLSVLKMKNLVAARKQGNNIYYSCNDQAVFQLLDVAKVIFNNQLMDVQETLKNL